MVVSAAAANWDLSDDEKVEVEEKTVPTLRKRKQAAAKTQAKADAELKPAKRVKKKPAEAKTPTTESTEDKEEKPASKTKEKVKKTHKTEKVEEGQTMSDDEDKTEVEKRGDGDETVEDETEEGKTKQKRKTVSANKRKSLKSKKNKRARKLNELKSKMPKADLEEYLAQREKGPDTPVDEASINYLRLWKSARSEWKFQKTRQVWLLQNIYNQKNINHKDFAILLEYMEPMKGKAKEQTVTEATEKLNEHKDSTEKEGEVIAKRATQILQIMG